MNEQEGKAAIRILGAVARADNKIDEREKAALKEAMIDFQAALPDGTTVESLLAEEVDLDAQLALVTSPVARRAVFESAIAMSLIDGAANAEENAVIARIRDAFAMSVPESLLQQTFESAYRSMAEPVLDPEVRRQKVDAVRSSRAVWAGVLGAMPVPFVGQVGVLLMFDSVTRDIALLWGHTLTRKERLARFGALVSFAFAQGAVQELLKLIPGWGTAAGAIGGGLFAFTSTWALARAVNHHFESGGKTTPEELKKVFADAKADGKKAFEEKKGEIEQGKAAHGEALAQLSKKLEKGEITSEEFDKRVAELAT
ncbi:MAG: TerB family tellurite resistance protein [Labilithrix sp.]|nr:TerB family tellurite resistance protein [Labilithrix sp.]